MELSDEVKKEARLPLRKFQHPSHIHRLTKTLSSGSTRFCDNDECNRDIDEGDVMFSCIPCEFDLCKRCFFLPTEREFVVVPVKEEDDDDPEQEEPRDDVRSVRIAHAVANNDGDEIGRREGGN